ncbi:hypothetical protein [Calidifontibacter indicus]|uniref:hypothetical protein n=1 Tax=Calidifontibacter indicus TaxID=419650 RepID=UPI003D7416AD
MEAEEMTTMTGAITPYLAVLGRPEDDPDVRALFDAQSDAAVTQTFHGPYAHYVSFHADGVGFLFEKNGLRAVTFYVEAEDDFSAYPEPQNLLDGLDAYTRDGVRAALGEPTASRGDDWDIYEVDGRFVHFEYDDEAVAWTVTLLAERVGR